MKHLCPCCSYLTFDEEPPGTFEICPVCGWEDDELQFSNPEYAGGANATSLNQAKINFSTIGAIDRTMLNKVRKPLPDEIPKRNKGPGSN